jgi:hypothetical protein
MERRRLAAGPRSPPGASAALVRLQRDMDRRRAGGVAALLRRVRWGNVGWLIALLAAGSVFVTGGGGDSPAGLPAGSPGAETSSRKEEGRQRRPRPQERARERRRPKPDRGRRPCPQERARERRRPKPDHRRLRPHGARTHQRGGPGRPTQTGETTQSNLRTPAEQVSSPVAVISPSPPTPPPPPVPRSGEFSPDPRLP